MFFSVSFAPACSSPRVGFAGYQRFSLLLGLEVCQTIEKWHGRNDCLNSSWAPCVRWTLGFHIGKSCCGTWPNATGSGLGCKRLAAQSIQPVTVALPFIVGPHHQCSLTHMARGHPQVEVTFWLRLIAEFIDAMLLSLAEHRTISGMGRAAIVPAGAHKPASGTKVCSTVSMSWT